MKNLDTNSFSQKFKGLNPKEMYNWNLVAQAAVGVFLFLILMAAGTVFYLSDQYAKLNKEVQKETALKAEFITKKKKAVNLPAYTAQLEEITKVSDNLLKQLPQKSEMEKLLIDINQVGISKGLQFELFKPSQEKLSNFYAELPINLRMVGKYNEIGAFTADIGQLSRVVLLTNINLTNKDGIVVFESTAKTFRYLDETELSKQKAEKIKLERDKSKKKNKKNKEEK